MKKFLALLLSALLLLSFAACKGNKDDDGTPSSPTSTPDSSQGSTTDDDSQDASKPEDSTSQNNSQTDKPNGIKPVTPPADPDPTDLTVYIPYNVEITEENSQYFPPALGDDGSISPGVTVVGKDFETPELFDVVKASTALKNEVANVTSAKLLEYVSKYATAYNGYYPESNYKLAVSVSGNTVKYTYTLSGEPAERKSHVIKALLDVHFEKYADFYKDFYKKQIANYKAAMPSINKIEVCVVRADNDPLLDDTNYTKDIMTKAFS
ncbi:MAG: hypothetical protein J6A78_03035 [Clostridia bacterium]|nr:hypothetical protein [Clostridia bacterium]